MKKTILIAAFMFATIANAQKFYVALGAGVTDVASPKELSSGSGLSGSYGEGYQGQVRFGYMLNKTFGLDLGVGYLHGKDQQIINSTGTNIIGHSRAYGASLAAVVNLSKNVYVRAGALTKLGGKTEIEGNIKSALPAGTTLVPLEIELSRNNTGKFPLGFMGAFGVKFDLNKKWGIFAEMEYQGINVDANKSELANFSAKLGGKNKSAKELQAVVSGAIAQIKSLPAGHPLTNQLPALYKLGGLLADEVIYTDNPNLDKFEAKSIQAPYSSFGFNIGITYNLGF